MSEKESPNHNLEHEKIDRSPEPQAGEGDRSLMQWQNMARLRESLAADTASREAYQLDPVGYMQRFGVDASHMVAPGQTEGVAPQMQNLQPGQAQGADMQLAFCKVWGVAIVVAGVVAVAAANVDIVVNAIAAANANAMANVNGVGPAGEEG